MEFKHLPVLLNETIEGLDVKSDGIYVDGTAGGGGHSSEILKRLKNGKLYSIDRDPDAIKTVTERFKDEPCSVIVKGRFGDMKQLLEELGVTEFFDVSANGAVGKFSRINKRKSRIYTFDEV